MRSGIYAITAPSGSQYIGSAIDIKARWRHHRYLLRRQKHFNRGVERAVRKYGLESLSFSTLLICAPADLIMFEQRAIDILKPKYNACRTAGSQLGVRHSDQTKAKISATKRGQYLEKQKQKPIILKSENGNPRHFDGFESRANTEIRQQVAAEYVGGSGLLDLCAKYHADHRALRRILIAEGVVIRSRGLTITPSARKLSPDEIGRRQATRRANAESRGYW